MNNNSWSILQALVTILDTSPVYLIEGADVQSLAGQIANGPQAAGDGLRILQSLVGFIDASSISPPGIGDRIKRLSQQIANSPQTDDELLRNLQVVIETMQDQERNSVTFSEATASSPDRRSDELANVLEGLARSVRELLYSRRWPMHETTA